MEMDCNLKKLVHVHLTEHSTRSVALIFLGTLSIDDEDVNENVRKQ